MSLLDRWTQILDDIRSRGCYRTLTLHSGVDLCSNDYLGYASRQWSGKTGPTESGRSATAARLLRGHYAIWDEVENALALWHRAERSLMFSSGFNANEGLLSTIITRDDWVASDQWNHASIIEGLRLSKASRTVYRHRDLNQLEDLLRSAAASRSPARELFIVTESLFGMDGDIAPLEEIVKLAEHYGANVIVDEAHATGCYGDTGSGLVDLLGLRDRVLATVHTGGKALAVFGAYVCGSKILRELLINRCRHFMFSTALPPALGAWWRDAINRIQADSTSRQMLHEAASWFRSELAKASVSARGAEYVVPILIGDNARAELVARTLRECNWDIRAIRTPTVPPGTARLRISIHADHDRKLLSEVASKLSEVLREVTS